MDKARSLRVAALGRFLLSAALTLFVMSIAAWFPAAAVAGSRQMVFDLVYRILWAGMLLGIYSLLESIADQAEDNPLVAQGFPRNAWLRDFLIGAGIGSVLVGLAVAVVATAGRVQRVRFYESGHAFKWAAAATVLLLCGALAEEISFRGYPFQKLVQAIGPSGAILVFSALFGLAHLKNPSATAWAVINTMAIGVLFAVAYLRTGALWLPWGLHFSWNFTLGMICGLPVSGLKTFSALVRTTVSGPVWLTGGGYGIEGSATGTAVIALGILAVFFLPLRGGSKSALASNEMPGLSV